MRVTIGMPIVDSTPGEAVAYHMMLAAKIARTSEVAIPTVLNEIPHDRARNRIFDIAIENNSDFLFFVDDDMITPPDAYCQLLEVFTYRKPRAVAVSGYYYRRGWPFTPVWSMKAPEGSTTPFLQLQAESGVHHIHYSGLGCCLIDVRWCAQNLEKPYFSMETTAEGTHITDDVTFFESIRIAGGVVYGNADVRCGHLSGRRVICDRTATVARREELELRQAEGLPELPPIDKV